MMIMMAIDGDIDGRKFSSKSKQIRTELLSQNFSDQNDSVRLIAINFFDPIRLFDSFSPSKIISHQNDHSSFDCDLIVPRNVAIEEVLSKPTIIRDNRIRFDSRFFPYSLDRKYFHRSSIVLTRSERIAFDRSLIQNLSRNSSNESFVSPKLSFDRITSIDKFCSSSSIQSLTSSSTVSTITSTTTKTTSSSPSSSQSSKILLPFYRSKSILCNVFFMNTLPRKKFLSAITLILLVSIFCFISTSIIDILISSSPSSTYSSSSSSNVRKEGENRYSNGLSSNLFSLLILNRKFSNLIALIKSSSRIESDHHHQHRLSNSLKPIELEEIFRNELIATDFNGSWISDTEILFYDIEYNLKVYDVHLLHSRTLIKFTEVVSVID